MAWVIEGFDVADNQLVGEIPSEFGLLGSLSKNTWTHGTDELLSPHLVQ